MDVGVESIAAKSAPTEQESLFILRLPVEPATALTEALRSGAANLKERFFIQLEPDKGTSSPHLRTGKVRFDGWSMSAKLMDLPTIIEAQKTIDNKTFYKSADICQILICKEGEFEDDEENTTAATTVEEASKKSLSSLLVAKKDAAKKFNFPHGLTPPLKNCRKRRFRRMLRKKYIEAPEIEKEVKRLLRVDHDAIDVKWDLIDESELSNKSISSVLPSPSLENAVTSDDLVVDEQDLFGALSDSDEDQRKDIDIDSEEEESNCQIFEAEQSCSYDGASMKADESNGASGITNDGSTLVTQFNSDMFPSSKSQSHNSPPNTVLRRLSELKEEIDRLSIRKRELLNNINTCDNQALINRFKEIHAETSSELEEKEKERNLLLSETN